MLRSKHTIFGLGLLGLASAGAGFQSVKAAEDDGASVYKPVQSISQRFGSTHASGYFLQQNGSCTVALYLAEGAGDEPAASYSGIRFALQPGGQAEIGSAEGRNLEVKCGSGASSLEVRQRNSASPWRLTSNEARSH